MMRSVVIALLLAASAAAAPARQAWHKLLGRQIFWAHDQLRLDTIGWYRVEKALLGCDSSERYLPRQAAGVFADSGKALLELRELSAVGAALLHDLGYRVVVLSQWNSTPSTRFSVTGPSVRGDDYKQRRAVSDFLWELVEKVELAPPGRLAEAFTVTLHFAGGGYARWPAAAELGKETAAMITPTDGISISFVGGTDLPLEFCRRIYGAWAVAPAGRTPKQIVAEVEKAMDKMKLDLSYRPPVLAPVKPAPRDSAGVP